jgi:very-short-patch-repair endonuclease
MTDAERRLWAALRGRRLQGFKFRRQRPLGPFIVDFACIEHRLVVEADGGQHADSQYDADRTAWLEKRGWRVLRFWNNGILANPEGVQEAVLQALAGGLPSG